MRSKRYSRTRWISLTLMCLLIWSGCEQPVGLYEPPAPTVSPTMPQAVEEVDRLIGVTQVRLNADGSVTLTGEPDTGDGIHMMMFDGSGKVVNAAILQTGRSVRLSDGRHVTIWYTLVNVEGRRMTFQITGQFDARPFGGDVNVYRKIAVVIPYP